MLQVTSERKMVAATSTVPSTRYHGYSYPVTSDEYWYTSSRSTGMVLRGTAVSFSDVFYVRVSTRTRTYYATYRFGLDMGGGSYVCLRVEPSPAS